MKEEYDMSKIVETPLMKQYQEMKMKHQDAVLLFRVGDFYETFSEDAITVSKILGITLTRRANGQSSHIELTGFPHHALDVYLPRLVRAGKRVAICEQLDTVPRNRSLVEKDQSRDLCAEALISLLTVLYEIINNLNLLVELRHHTREIRRISKVFCITPLSAFTGCFECETQSLFGC